MFKGEGLWWVFLVVDVEDLSVLDEYIFDINDVVFDG